METNFRSPGPVESYDSGRIQALCESIRSEEGDTEVQEEFYHLCQKLMERSAWFQFGLTPTNVEDQIQDSFIKVVRTIRSGEFVHTNAADFRGWIQRIFVNTFLDSVKRRRTVMASDTVSLESKEYALHTSGDDQMANLIRKEKRNKVRKAIMTLDEKYRVPLILREIEERTYEEIAHILDLPGGTVKSRINRGRELLKERLQVQGTPKS